MMQFSSSGEGGLNGWMITTFVSLVFILTLGGMSAWLYTNYTEQKSNVNAKIDAAVSKAIKEQADADADKFAEREKEPLREFVGPVDYGRVTFNYPKTWSLYIATVVSNGGTYQAYLNPISVPMVSPNTQYALRVTIEQRDYDKVLVAYESLVKKGSLKSSNVAVNGEIGTRYDGSFSNDIRGAAVIFKIRDKTLTIRTDSNTFLPDFEELIKTIKYNA